jgi:predicted metal-binding protein
MAPGMKDHVCAEWSGAILVCGKCSKKLGGGFGPKGRTPLGKALRKLLGLKRSRKAPLGVVEVGCLKICPKGAVTLVDTAAPGRWRLVPAGTPVEVVARDLGLAQA